jgi:hypothetical protein
MLVIGIATPVQAGHETFYYPSFYPQGIRVEFVDPQVASARLRSGSLQAIIGGDPLASAPRLPTQTSAPLGQIVSLDSYVVLTVDGPAARLQTKATSCALARQTYPLFRRPIPGFVFYPYPITPYHPDYLHHADLIASVQQTRSASQLDAANAADVPVRLRATGPAKPWLRALAQAANGPWDATIEEIGVGDLLAGAVSAFPAVSPPPWMKEGWFQTYLLLTGAIRDRVVRDGAEALYHRLTEARYRDPVEKVNLERKLVSLLTSGCDRIVVGYTLRRESYNTDYSAGIEDIAFDAQTGLNSAIFPRTVKLKEFPWNGWLTVGLTSPPAAAWNPVAGFTDPFGRFLWAALSDPALLPGPSSSAWIPNRVEWTLPAEPAGPALSRAAGFLWIPVPADALLPAPTGGSWQQVGPGKTAALKLTYRVRTSSFHDGTTMTLADVLCAYAFANRWPTSAPSSAPAAATPHGERATPPLGTWLRGIRLLRVEDAVKKFLDVELRWKIPVVEVYLAHAPADPSQAAAIAPPWSPLPWHLMILMDEAVRRGIVAYAATDAQRRRVPWLDLVRDRTTSERLTQLVREFARTGYRPPFLSAVVTNAEATERWRALLQFHRQWGHFLVTNGPYLLEKWSARDVTLVAFRDLSYPLTIGAFDRFSTPRRAYVTKVVRRGAVLEIEADVERLLKFQRSYEIIREPLSRDSSAGLDRVKAICQYLVVNGDGQVAQIGAAEDAVSGVFRIQLDQASADPARILVAIYLNDNYITPEVKDIALADR